LGQDDRNDEGRSERHELDLAELFGRGERLADEQDRQCDQELQDCACDCDGNGVTITQLTQHGYPRLIGTGRSGWRVQIERQIVAVNGQEFLLFGPVAPFDPKLTLAKCPLSNHCIISPFLMHGSH